MLLADTLEFPHPVGASWQTSDFGGRMDRDLQDMHDMHTASFFILVDN
jgi:hypothetical protein